ncbi:uncharacterized protein LOC125998989 [Suncus etruscus]|uniref:uncharacterized protein LOC125998989 n=1 Tax=Suncus etruscus TaxID=109475 RepID=UPI00210F2959|nr:uncharacterized protein LOC125998989 [Suncus etruscus]
MGRTPVAEALNRFRAVSHSRSNHRPRLCFISLEGPRTGRGALGTGRGRWWRLPPEARPPRLPSPALLGATFPRAVFIPLAHPVPSVQRPRTAILGVISRKNAKAQPGVLSIRPSASTLGTSQGSPSPSRPETLGLRARGGSVRPPGVPCPVPMCDRSSQRPPRSPAASVLEHPRFLRHPRSPAPAVPSRPSRSPAHTRPPRTPPSPDVPPSAPRPYPRWSTPLPATPSFCLLFGLWVPPPLPRSRPCTPRARSYLAQVAAPRPWPRPAGPLLVAAPSPPSALRPAGPLHLPVPTRSSRRRSPTHPSRGRRLAIPRPPIHTPRTSSAPPRSLARSLTRSPGPCSGPGEPLHPAAARPAREHESGSDRSYRARLAEGAPGAAVGSVLGDTGRWQSRPQAWLGRFAGRCRSWSDLDDFIGTLPSSHLKPQKRSSSGTGGRERRS